MEFPSFHLQVIRDNRGQATRTMSYGESLSVAWLISWRLLTLFSLPLMTGMAVWVAFVGWDAAMSQAQDVPDAVSWLVGTPVQFLIFFVWIVKPLLHKRYAFFSLKLERSAMKDA